jgi:hypothetical protein
MTETDYRFALSPEDISALIKAATEMKINGSPIRSTITKALDRIDLLMKMSNPTHQDTIDCLLDVQDILTSFN